MMFKVFLSMFVVGAPMAVFFGLAATRTKDPLVMNGLSGLGVLLTCIGGVGAVLTAIWTFS